jgi:aspartate kinase
MPQRLIVLKFGGTALGSARRLRVAARRLAAWHRKGFHILAVASATGHTTDRIARRLAAVGADPLHAPGPETDHALATGELLSAALLATAVQSTGIGAESLSGHTAGLSAAGVWGAGVLESFDPNPIQHLLGRGVIPIVAGFQAGTASGRLITLGRGASDLSAVFLGARLGADECHIVTDVQGVSERDPRHDPSAEPLGWLSPAALLALAESGAEVVHRRAARLAVEENLTLRVYRWDASLRGDPGTLIAVRAPATTAAS